MAGSSGQQKSVFRFPPFTDEPTIPESTVPGVIDASTLRSLDGALSRAGLSNTVLRYIVRTVAVALTVSVTVDILTHHGAAKLFSWHPIFITLGFVGLMSEGILLGTAFRSLDGPERVDAIIRHALMQVAACIAIAIGFWAIYQNKINFGKTHWKSWHSFWGLPITIAALLVAIGGAVSFRRIGLLAKLPAHIQPLVKAAHRYSGPVVWLCAMGNMLLGLRTHGAGPKWLLHCIDAAGIIVMTAAQGLLLLQSSSASATSLPDAAAVAHESEILLSERSKLEVSLKEARARASPTSLRSMSEQ